MERTGNGRHNQGRATLRKALEKHVNVAQGRQVHLRRGWMQHAIDRQRFELLSDDDEEPPGNAILSPLRTYLRPAKYTHACAD